MGKRGLAGILYWYLVVVLLAFGLLAIAGIGLPFLILGVSLAVLSPSRARPRLFWPVLYGIAGFLLGFSLVAPLSCRASEAARIPPGRATVCTSLLGIEYSGADPYTPPVWPAAAAGLAVAMPGWAVGRRATQSRKVPA